MAAVRATNVEDCELLLLFKLCKALVRSEPVCCIGVWLGVALADEDEGIFTIDIGDPTSIRRRKVKKNIKKL